MAMSQTYLDRVEAQRRQVRRAREYLDEAEAEFHAAADAWEAADDPHGELLYAYKGAAVWLSHVAEIHQRAIASQDLMLARMFIRDEDIG